MVYVQGRTVKLQVGILKIYKKTIQVIFCLILPRWVSYRLSTSDAHEWFFFIHFRDGGSSPSLSSFEYAFRKVLVVCRVYFELRFPAKSNCWVFSWFALSPLQPFKAPHPVYANSLSFWPSQIFSSSRKPIQTLNLYAIMSLQHIFGQLWQTQLLYIERNMSANNWGIDPNFSLADWNSVDKEMGNSAGKLKMLWLFWGRHPEIL